MTRLFVPVAGVLAGIVLFTQPAAANVQEKTVFHVDETYTETAVCPFDITVHLEGSFKVVAYYDNTGFLYKEIATPGGGSPFVVSYTAHGTTLTHNENYSTVVMYNPDGTWTYTQRGPYNVFTAPGRGIVFHDTGTATWTEPNETLVFMSGGQHQAIAGDFDAFCAAFG